VATPVEILFSVPNFRDVQSAIGNVQSSLDKLSRAGQSAHDRAAKAADKSFKDTAKAADKSSREATRAVDREAREQIRIRNAVNQLEVKSWQEKERAKTRSLNEEARKRANAEKATFQESKTAHERLVRDAESRARSFGRAGGGAVTRALGTAGRIAGTVAAIGGGFTIADALGKGIRDETTSGIIFRGAANKGGFGSSKEVKDLAQATAIKTGGTTEEMLAGLDQFVRKTGDLGAARNMLEDMAKMSAATGTNFADLGNTAAEVQNQLQDPKKTLEVMRALIGQGMAGAIDIKDLGQYGGRLAASAAQYEGGLAGNIESFGAIAQLAKKLGGATDTAEATESVARLSSDMAKHESGFKAIGVDVFADKGKTKFRNAEDVITESVVKSGGNMTILKELFGERSIRAAIGAQVAYANAGGGSAGEAAIRGQFSSLKSNTPTQSAIDKGAAEAMEERQRKINVALEKLGKVFDEQLGPLIPKLVEKLIELIPAIESMLKFFTNQSAWVGVGALVGAALVAEIATAGIGAGVGAALTAVIKAITVPAAASSVASVIGSAGMSAAGGAAAAGAGTATGAGAAAVGTWALGTAAGFAGILGVGVGALYGISKISQSRAEGRVSDVLAEGEATPEEKRKKLADVQSLIAQSAARDAANKKHRNASGTIVNTDLVTPDEATAMGSSTAVAASKEMEKLTTVLQSLQQSLQQMNEKAKEIASIEVPTGGPTNPGDPTRGSAAR